MKKNNLSQTIFQLYHLFLFSDSTDYIISQIMEYFFSHDLWIQDLSVDEEYLTQNSLLSTFLKEDPFYIVIYKIRKIQECIFLIRLKSPLFHVYLETCYNMLDKILTFILYEKTSSYLMNKTVMEYVKIHSLFKYLLDTDYLPLSSILITNENTNLSLFDTSNALHNTSEQINRKTYLFRTQAKEKCHKICKIEHKDSLIAFKKEMESLDIQQYPFAAIYQRNFQEVYTSLMKTIQEKSRSRKRVTSTYEYPSKLF